MTRRILIVEDEDDLREVAAVALEVTAGWEVVGTASGVQAVEIARSQAPDAILLDVMMPDLDGPSTLRALRGDSDTAGIPVLFLTAKVQAADRSRYTELGAEGVIAKPFDPMTLADAIREALGWER